MADRSKLVPRSLGLVSTGRKHNSTFLVDEGLFELLFSLSHNVGCVLSHRFICLNVTSAYKWGLLQYQSEVVNIVYLYMT